jgi:Zn-dependent protease with chaperone function
VTIPYGVRLICVSLAAFTLTFAAIGLLIAAFAPFALRSAERLPSSLAARMILTLRLLPAVFAMSMVAAICVPSYIRFEQRDTYEEAGAVCLTLAGVALSLFLVSLIRTALAWRRSINPSASLALVGVLRPRMVISRAAQEALSAPQLELAISHERAHQSRHDNLKRLLILLAPGPFPHFGELEKAWKRFAEYAADDRAACGDADRSISLAAALVQIAKLGEASDPPLATSFLGSGHDLESRVNRLLNPRPVVAMRFPDYAFLLPPAALVFASLYPATPSYVHALLERLMH